MDESQVLHLGRKVLETALMLSAPVMIVAISVGLITAMLQAITSIRDMTLGMVLKIAAVGATLLIFGGWMMSIAVRFTYEIFQVIDQLGH